MLLLRVICEMAFPKEKKIRRQAKSAAERAEANSLGTLLERIRQGPCQACGKVTRCDIEHLRTRAAGGTNREFNLWSACRTCHIEKGSQGISHMVAKYPRFKEMILEKGWVYDDYMQKWWHD